MIALLILSLFTATEKKVLYVKTDDVALHATPDVDSKVLSKLKKGDALTWKETSTVNGAMQDVTFKKQHGFVRTVDVTPFKADENPDSKEGEPQPLGVGAGAAADDETASVVFPYTPTDPALVQALQTLDALQASTAAQQAHVAEHKLKAGLKGKK